jgi:nucleoside recognition membrane protein YjiH
MLHHHYHSPHKRALIAFVLVGCVMILGTVGLHVIEKVSLVDAFYFMSMIATAQGPTMALTTVAGKIFASVMAFVSIGITVAALSYLFGPLLGKLGLIGVEHLQELRKLKDKDKDKDKEKEKG